MNPLVNSRGRPRLRIGAETMPEDEQARILREIRELQEERARNPQGESAFAGPRGPYQGRQTGRKLQRAGGAS